MNLQQTYDLIGQILKERPELSELTVQFLNINPICCVLQNGCIWFCSDKCYEYYNAEEILWQPQ